MGYQKRMLPSPESNILGLIAMPSYQIRFHERDTLPDLMERRASELGITVEQLILRFICTGMQDYETLDGPAVPGDSLDDFFVKNGALKES
jgi:hypothetical protein